MNTFTQNKHCIVTIQVLVVSKRVFVFFTYFPINKIKTVSTFKDSFSKIFLNVGATYDVYLSSHWTSLTMYIPFICQFKEDHELVRAFSPVLIDLWFEIIFA